jgi:hypothetical protein
MKLLLFVLGIVMGCDTMAQSQLDTLIQMRKTGFIEGKVPTHYSPGHEAIATEFQKTITAAIGYYEKKYHKVFEVKLVVLDSAQWLNEVVPFGLIFYSKGWIVMNAGMRYQMFADLYGLDAYYADIELKKGKLTHNDFITSVFKFYSVHELMHYFINELSNAKSPDKWTNEVIPTYLAYNFFKEEKPKELKGMEIFSSISKNYYSPAYSSISDFNEKYAGVGIPNYVWYQSSFYFFAKSLSSCKDNNFFSSFEHTFSKSDTGTYTNGEIINFMDKGCASLVTTWVKEMASKAKK